MAQHDQNIANDNGANVRVDINAALAALFGLSSGATAPTTTIPYMFWADTTTGLLKQRNAANSGWIIKGDLASHNWGLSAKSVQDFRLTLVSGLPVPISDVTGATTIYATPTTGNQIGLYDGTNWNIRASAEFSIALGTLTANKPYDVFCYDNAGTPTLEILAWTNDTTRATGLGEQDGIPIKWGTPTRRYLGTFWTTSATQTEDSKQNRCLWNLYHQAARKVAILDNSGGHTYTTATERLVNNNANNMANVVVGVAGHAFKAQASMRANNSSTGVAVRTGIGIDATASHADSIADAAYTQVSSVNMPINARISTTLPAGRHTVQWLEYSAATGTTSFYTGNADGVAYCGGLHGTIIG